MARPTKLTPEVHEAIVDGINAGLTFRLSCARAGVTPATFYNWLEKGEVAQSGALMEFFNAVERAKADSALRLISQITLQAPAGPAVRTAMMATRWSGSVWPHAQIRPVTVLRPSVLGAAWESSK